MKSAIAMMIMARGTIGILALALWAPNCAWADGLTAFGLYNICNNLGAQTAEERDKGETACGAYFMGLTVSGKPTTH